MLASEYVSILTLLSGILTMGGGGGGGVIFYLLYWSISGPASLSKYVTVLF